MESNKLLIPGAIVVAGLLIAGALFFADGSGSGSNNVDTAENSQPEGQQDIAINPINEEDHILGNPNAQIKIVEYSDIDCPFCSDFHQTMHRVIDEYGSQGQVAWVYRHFPLAQLHPDAQAKAEASECVASLGGNEAFWNYIDILFERDETTAQLASIAGEVGVDSAEFQSCLDEGRFEGEVQEDFDDARRSGGTGTPHNIIVIEETGELVPLSGAVPFETVQEVIEAIMEDGEPANN